MFCLGILFLGLYWLELWFCRFGFSFDCLLCFTVNCVLILFGCG